MPKYSRVTVFRCALGDSTNGGVSSTHWELFIEDPDGQELSTPPDPNLVFRVEDRGGGYLAMVPIVRQEAMVGPMFGGNIASSLQGPKGTLTYRIHDRFEIYE